MSLKVLCIGDQHYKKDNIFETNVFETKLLDLISKTTFDFAVFMGDFLHQHEVLNMPTLNRVERFLLKLSDLKQLYILIGNHDRINNKSFLSMDFPFVGLEKTKNIKIIWKTELIEFKNHKILFVPYVYPGRFKEALNTIEFNISEITAVFAHQEFKGCAFNNKTSENGDTWFLENPLLISGHIHMYQRLQHNLIYVGSCMQVAFDETQDKTVSIFEFSDDKKWTEQRVDLDLPKKITLNLNSTQLNEIKIDSQNKYKIFLWSTMSEKKTLMQSTQVQELEKQGVKIVYKIIEDNTIEKTAEKLHEIIKDSRKNYNQVLFERISENLELSKLYQEINKN